MAKNKNVNVDVAIQKVSEPAGSPRIVGRTVRIEAHSRRADKINDTYWTFEAVETRELSLDENPDMELEWKNLWDTVNAEVDKQVSDAASCE